MVVHGIVQHDEAVVHVIASRLEDGTPMLRELSEDAMPSTLSNGDGGGAQGAIIRPPTHAHPRNVSVIPKSRDFH